MQQPLKISNCVDFRTYLTQLFAAQWKSFLRFFAISPSRHFGSFVTATAHFSFTEGIQPGSSIIFYTNVIALYTI